MTKKQTEVVMAQMEKLRGTLKDLRCSVQYVSDEVDTLYMFAHYWEEPKKGKK